MAPRLPARARAPIGNGSGQNHSSEGSAISPGVQEPPGLQQAQLFMGSACRKKGTVEVVRAARRPDRRRRLRMPPDKIEPFPGKRSARAAPRQVESRSRPFMVAPTEKREIEQPFARIVEDFHTKFGGPASSTTDQAGGREAQREINPAQIGRTCRPARRVGRERGDRVVNRELIDRFVIGCK